MAVPETLSQVPGGQMRCKNMDENRLCHAEGADGLYECLWFLPEKCPGFVPAEGEEGK